MLDSELKSCKLQH